MPNFRYINGSINTFADWLSRRPDFAHLNCPKCNHFIKNVGKHGSINAISAPATQLASQLISTLQESQFQDEFCQLLDQWQSNLQTIPPSKTGFFKSFTRDLETKLWKFESTAAVIPKSNRLGILEYFHNRVDHGHFGFQKTLKEMKSQVYWPTMPKDVQNFIHSCPECQRTKATRHGNNGLLHPLEIPDTRFESISIDFATMPLSANGFNSMVIITDRFSKLFELIPVKNTITAHDFASEFYKNWYLKGYGFPKSIVSDQDVRFTSSFWLEFSRLGIFSMWRTPRRHPGSSLLEHLL